MFPGVKRIRLQNHKTFSKLLFKANSSFVHILGVFVLKVKWASVKTRLMLKGVHACLIPECLLLVLGECNIKERCSMWNIIWHGKRMCFSVVRPFYTSLQGKESNKINEWVKIQV